jgi:hypothetical protein
MMRAEPVSAFNRVMLQSTRRGFFRHSYEISEDGRPTVTLTGTRREGCSFELDDEPYRVTRDGRKAFVLTGPWGEAARAERVGSRTWTVSSLHVPLELVRTSIWKETWEVRRFGEPVGTLSKDGAFKNTSTADLPDDLPLFLRLFVVCVVEALWERSRQAAAAGGS